MQRQHISIHPAGLRSHANGGRNGTSRKAKKGGLGMALGAVAGLVTGAAGSSLLHSAQGRIGRVGGRRYGDRVEYIDGRYDDRVDYLDDELNRPDVIEGRDRYDDDVLEARDDYVESYEDTYGGGGDDYGDEY